MNRMRMALVLAAGIVVVLIAGLLVVTQKVSAAADMNLAQSLKWQEPLAPTAGVTCTLSTTSTVQSPNQSFDTALILSPASNLVLVPPTNVPPGTTVDVLSIDNYFQINVIAGNSVSVSAIPANSAAGNYNLGLEVYDNTRTLIASDTNTSNFRADISLVAGYSGVMYFRIYQLAAAARCTGGFYSTEFSNTPPTATPTGTPRPTATITLTPGPFACATGSDTFEPNNEYDTATTVGLGVKYTNLNFVECITSNTEWDNDFFKARVKPGMLVTCRTTDLSPGTDTNLILYDVNRNGINGQDDLNRAAGDLSSSVTYYVTYEGWLYGLVGEGFHRPFSEQSKATYSYECTITSQFTPTPAPTPTDRPDVPTRTPVPPTPTETPIPTPTLSPTPPSIRVIPLPTATPVGLPLKSIPVSLQVYYDADSNNKPDPGEGIIGVSARVYDLSTGSLLAQGLTDQTGRVSFTVSAPGAVQLVVPYFNYSTIILPNQGGAAVLRISARELPQSIP